ncbi:MAG: segregation/condensation protein A [Litorilinea sp.]
MSDAPFPAGYRPANPFNHRTPEYGSSYPVQLPVFQGPLDLLLFLIEREELDINEVSLVAVTDQYLRTIELWEEIEPGALADFLVVASRLLYIKSSRLLPRPASGEEDEEGPDALIRHLLEYRQFKRIAESLREWEDAGRRVFARPAAPADAANVAVRPPDLSAVDLPLLQKALQRALARIPDEPPPPRVHLYTVTVAEKIEEVRAEIRRVMATLTGDAADKPVRLAFSDLVETCRSRLEIVVTFLAVLELMKQYELTARQAETFGEILLEHDPHAAEMAEPVPGDEDESA